MDHGPGRRIEFCTIKGQLRLFSPAIIDGETFDAKSSRYHKSRDLFRLLQCNITRLLACQLEHPLVVNLGDFTARRVRASASVADKYASGIGRNENNPALSRAEKFKFMYTTEPRTATRPPLSSYT